jgi:hypothetical protein
MRWALMVVELELGKRRGDGPGPARPGARGPHPRMGRTRSRLLSLPTYSPTGGPALARKGGPAVSVLPWRSGGGPGRAAVGPA